jgi:EAL domain-containing protein (putative c-di-GMP-specific phosphodiesterase class I)/CHASE2 domain-containing sensor protein
LAGYLRALKPVDDRGGVRATRYKMNTHATPRTYRGPRSAAVRLRTLFSRGHASKQKVDSSLPSARRRIVLWAMALGLVAGAIELFMPIEDSYRAVRAMAREHPADGKTAVVFVVNSSLEELGVNDPDRADDARVIDKLFAMGANRVFFDRAYSDPGRPAGDAQLISAMRGHRGNVFIGASPVTDNDESAAIYPHRKFRSEAEVLSLAGEEGPLGLSVHFPTSTEIHGVDLPSLSAKIAGLNRSGGSYRVDFAIDYKTIPTARYVDVLRDRVQGNPFQGTDVIIAPSSRTSPDFHPIPFNRKIAGSLLHAMGAETLRKGYPLDLGWLPAFLATCAVVLYQSRRTRPATRVTVAAFAALAVIPLALDLVQVSIDVMPALLCLTIAAIRLGRLSRDAYRGSSDLQNLTMLQGKRANDQVDVIALKIRNFATISALLTPDQVEELLAKARAMLQSTDESAEFAFDKDTFVWLASRLRHGDLEDHLRGLHALFSTSISVGAQAPDLASSIGVDVEYTASLRERTETAIQCAEDAAHAGRIFMIAEPRMVEDRVWRLQILSELENAIRTEGVEVHFQPKIALATGAIAGAEALMRWNHPTRGWVEPSQVVGIAEEHNRVDMITRFVLNRAISQARRALAVDPSFKIAINISALDLRDPMFVSQVEQLLAAYRFPAANLVLEITETAPIENDDAIAATFEGLKRLGVKLSVDDFGIGHASLHYLRRIPADEVKIDRSFVTLMDTSIEDRALVRTSIEMIHSLGRTAVAEGVENQAVVDLLREMGCDAAQGYFFAKAMPMDQLLARLGARTMAA